MMRLLTRLLMVGLLFVVAVLAIGCSSVSVPLIVNLAPTQPPTQVPLPTRVVLAVPTPTLNLVPPGDSAEAAVMLKDFVAAVSTGNVDGALTYWNTSQSSTYAANARKMVQEWADKKRQLVLGEITYMGRDTTGKSVPMPVTDPHMTRQSPKCKLMELNISFISANSKADGLLRESIRLRSDGGVRC